MSGWLVVPAGDPERLHVVPAKGNDPDPTHVPSADCPCRPRICVERNLAGEPKQIVVHSGPN